MDNKKFLVAMTIFVAINLLFTAVGVTSAKPEEAVGGLRPLYLIPPKVVQLIAVGLAMGAASLIALRRLEIRLLAFAAALTVLVDVDHLPVFLNMSQPIRPSHSILFLLTVGAAVYLVLRRTDLALIASSSILIHFTADGSDFPLLSPLTFTLYDFGATGGLVFTSAAILLALLAGYAAKKRVAKVQASGKRDTLLTSV